ncbi:MAG: hypothetical protein K8F91_03760 [Candidatus Obscuribacterales bacterium]|nr:hypothetical protein [Candidatus Obscuribacterales bacterium]
MNNLEQLPVDVGSDQFSSGENPFIPEGMEHKIGGYDRGTRSIRKEPSLYLSIAIIFVATSVCLGKTPAVFWVSFVVLSAVAIMLHALSERMIFRTKSDFDAFAAPFEGVFVVTFGAILPGLALLAYGIYSLSAAQKPNVLEEIAKLALLLLVPLFNFIVWQAVRKGYLIRPRLIGLMNGLALGLSTSWMLIWLKLLLFTSGGPSCKFGWMLLLSTSPFLLLAAACMNFDFWRKTESSIARITTTFSILGVLLSMLFVCTPMVRAFLVQSLIADSKFESAIKQASAISSLRLLSAPEDLRPSRHPVSGFALSALLFPHRGLDDGNDVDRDVYFRIRSSLIRRLARTTIPQMR